MRSPSGAGALEMAASAVRQVLDDRRLQAFLVRFDASLTLM
jgi:hypothetical protein